jgi:hypothetical protein
MRSHTFAVLARSCLILALCAAPSCFADSVITDTTPAESSLSMLELEQALFGFDPADGYSIAQQNQLWTTNANAALYSNLFALITTLGGEQSMIDELFQPGAIFAGEGDPFVQVNGQALLSIQGTSSQSGVPEPATMGLLGGALLFFCCYAFLRSARTLSHGPIQRAD